MAPSRRLSEVTAAPAPPADNTTSHPSASPQMPLSPSTLYSVKQQCGPFNDANDDAVVESDSTSSIVVDTSESDLPFSKGRCVALAATLAGTSFMNVCFLQLQITDENPCFKSLDGTADG